LNWKRIAAVLSVCFLLLAGMPVSAEDPEISAYAAVVYDPLTESVLYEKNSGEVLPMASTTKIMTALLAFESGRAEEPVEITEEMVAVEGSSMGLMPGDVLTLGNLASGMMLASGNDGANAIAVFLGGDAEGFAAQMNARAAEIGMTQSQFVTPSGLDAEGHGSTALDMARLAAAAMENPMFRETVGQSALSVPFLSPEKSVRYENHNRLLQLYEGCIGIKTGFTKKAGRCLVSAAERDGAMLICVTLNAPDDWNDHAALLDHGFAQFLERTLPIEAGARFLSVAGGESDLVLCRAEVLPRAVLPETAEVSVRAVMPRFVYAPVNAGDIVGALVYTVNDTIVAEVPLIAGADVPAAEEPRNAFEKWLDRVFG